MPHRKNRGNKKYTRKKGKRKDKKKPAKQYKVTNNRGYINECKHIHKCEAITRIIKCLNEYQKMDIKQDMIYNDHTFKHLVNDFQHVLLIHLSDTNALSTTIKEYELIHDYIIKNTKKCELETCDAFQRNNRNREKENIFLLSTNKQTNIHKEIEYFVDLMDNVHCYFMHSFDIGFRIRNNEFNNVININNENEEKNESNRQIIMQKFKQFIKKKRKIHVQRTTNSKFVTNINNNDTKEDTKENDITDSYSFGHRYKYWERKKVPGNDIHISPKYSNLCDELLNNKIFQIDRDDFEGTKTKSQKLIKSTHSKKLYADEGFSTLYDIKKRTPISKQHIMALIFYTSFDNLQTEFSKTFRSLNQRQGEKNKEYAIWSRLLIEAVNVYGTTIFKSKIEMYYHGINCLLLFNEFVTSFNAPTSTTPQKTVAAIFARNDGCILQLAGDHMLLRYFNVSWLSTFSYEDERLFVMPHDFGMVLRFSSIISMTNDMDYCDYIHALTSFNYVIDNKQSFEGLWDRQHQIKENDTQVINDLLTNKPKTTYKHPLYAKQLFNSFTKNKKEINIKISTLNHEYIAFKENLGINMLKVTNLCGLFTNCEKITFNFNEGKRVRDRKPGTISPAFFENLLSEIIILNKKKKRSLELIGFSWCKYDASTLESYKIRFIKQNWMVTEHLDKQWLAISKLDVQSLHDVSQMFNIDSSLIYQMLNDGFQM